jgi:hypothetical protein
MTLGNGAEARVGLIVRCLDCRHRVEPDPGEMTERYRTYSFLYGPISFADRRRDDDPGMAGLSFAQASNRRFDASGLFAASAGRGGSIWLLRGPSSGRDHYGRVRFDPMARVYDAGLEIRRQPSRLIVAIGRTCWFVRAHRRYARLNMGTE